ncbi:Flavin-containing monooxygenase [Mycena kentingensis (nom. inval.)]|nr:Flavin-containing monooxygenase [Mycena kentingensis (nom. inval.)]
MTVQIPEYPLPTLDRLSVAAESILDSLDANAIASEWLDAFKAALKDSPASIVQDLFIPDSHWRDILALTWDFRAFHGATSIQTFLTDRASGIAPDTVALAPGAMLARPYPDLVWINAFFGFATTTGGTCSGIFRLVPTASGAWKAHCVFTNLEDLAGFPEKDRDFAPNNGTWVQQRRAALDAYESESPTVLVIGAGHSGLVLAARLKALGVRTLLVERNARIGDNWRHRYDSLCLHDPVWYDQLPYLPYPPNWPVYTPAMKLGNWLEHYAEALELDVWTSAKVVSARPNASGDWTAVVSRPNSADRTFTVKHVVFAVGGGGLKPKMPTLPGMAIFKGEVLHSTQHKRAQDYQGKKVVVVGACTSAHDIAEDCYNNGVDVTLFQRSSTFVFSEKAAAERLMKPLYWEGGPPTDVADRLAASFPMFGFVDFYRRARVAMEEDDKELHKGLRRVGFRLNKGVADAGVLLTAFTGDGPGGFYLDVGGSQLLIDGKVKLKNDSQIEKFTVDGLQFENGSKLDADVVIFATGVGDPAEHTRHICGDAVADQCPPQWGLNSEGEMNAAWRDMGVKGLWYMTGNFSMARFYSKRLALQIKAMEEGVWDGTRYSSKK